ncbi:hypothetical protein LINPERPRIM_LOCUS8612 [Linum perenne]
MSYMQCYRPVEQVDPCYQQAKPHQSAGIYDTFHHTNQQQQHHHNNTHGVFPQTHSANAPTSLPMAKTNSNCDVSGYSNHKYGQHAQGTGGFVGSTGHPAQHGSHTMSGAVGSFKSEKKMKEKYSSEYKKKSSGHKKNKNKCGNGSGSDSSSGSDSD